jgi:hypothetical protein
LKLHPALRVYASLLNHCGEDARHLTFGLSGLNEQGTTENEQGLAVSGSEPIALCEAAKLTLLHAMRPQGTPDKVCSNRFVNINKNSRSAIHVKLTQRFSGVGWYNVDPR